MAFHWRNGWYFKRDEPGIVTIWNDDLKIRLEIPPMEWASIVASVCFQGETGETFASRAALCLMRASWQRSSFGSPMTTTYRAACLNRISMITMSESLLTNCADAMGPGTTTDASGVAPANRQINM
jgi:hypothetical protein